MSNEYDDRKRLTFEQAEGVAQLPSQLKLKEVSAPLRARMWAVFHRSLSESAHYGIMYGDRPLIRDPWATILFDHHVLREHGMADEFVNDPDSLITKVKSIFTDGDYVTFFGFIQWVLRHRNKPYQLDRAVTKILESCHAAYTVFDGDTIVPIGSDSERATLEKAFADLATKEFQGARAHLRKAGSELTAGNFGPSIRESIHAVESVARVLDPKASTLGPALARLEKAIRIHGALKEGFKNLYGYTSDEKGVRHALIEDSKSPVDETDALYMLGSCASFVSYLINKARLSDLMSKNNDPKVGKQ